MDTVAAAPQIKASPAGMSPQELCYHLRDLLDEHIGDVKGLCADASLILACVLRARGLDASLCTGAYVMPPAELGNGDEEHAYVRLDGLIYDPTREQFEPLPLVADEGAPQYQGEGWGSEAPPEHPRPSDLTAYFWRCYPHADCYMRAGMFRICTELGLGDIDSGPGQSAHE